MRNNTTDVTGGKTIAVNSQSDSDVSAFNILIAYYDMNGRKGEIIFFVLSHETYETLFLPVFFINLM
jgi:hypothetical protein